MFFGLIMEFSLEDFVAHPSLEKFEQCTKNNLFSIAAHFKVPIAKQDKKQNIKYQLHIALAEKNLLPPVSSVPSYAITHPDPEVRKLELQVEMRRLELKEKELQHDFELCKFEIEETEQRESARLRARQMSSEFVTTEADFDVNKCICLIPPFSERDVDKYFVLFERVATTLKWPIEIWPLLLQCMFMGKAQEAYASLSPEVSLNYDQVKSAVLRSYELVPEAYRQKFRRYKKAEGQSYVEFGHEKIALFDRWCSAQDVKNFEQLCDLILMEAFKKCLSDKIATYLNEQKVTNVSAAAILADEYVLIHRESFEKPSIPLSQRGSVTHTYSSEHVNFKDEARPVCAYCKKRSHLINNCFLLNKKKPKTVALVKMPSVPHFSESESVDLDIYSPFIMKGTVSLPDSCIKVPVTILRDTAASRSIILQSVLLLSNEASLNCSELVQGFGMKFVNLPVHIVQLDSVPRHIWISQLKQVFIRLTEANLTVNLAKCDFVKATVVYLGKIVGGGMVKPVNAKIEAITSFPVPSTRRELQQFLGMAGYYRSFCKNF